MAVTGFVQKDYYDEIMMKYVQLTGCVVRINSFWGSIHVGEEVIDFKEIYDIKAMTLSGEI